MRRPCPASLRRRLTAPLLLLMSLTAGCASHSQFVPSGRTALKIPDADQAMLVIFLHGSIGGGKHDPCRPDGGFVYSAMAVPQVLIDLARRNRNIHVYAHCSERISDVMANESEKVRRTPCTGGSERFAYLHTKECKRAAELRALVDRFIRENPGLDRRRIFLSGTSSGAWASLLAKRRWPGVANAVVGFAPAFSGHYAARVAQSGGKTGRMFVKCRGINGHRTRRDLIRKTAGTEKIRFCHVDYIASGSVPALLFAFDGDPYENAATLKPFGASPGIRLIGVPQPPQAADACRSRTFPPLPDVAHRCNHRDWFSPAYYALIRSYLMCRARTPNATCHGARRPQG